MNGPIVLAAINARWTHTNLAIRYLRDSIMSTSAIEPVLREYFINQKTLDILQDIVALNPEALLLSVSIWNSRLVQGLLPDIRALLPECRIILGGPEVSYQADEWLKNCPSIDLIVSGAGEGAVSLLANVDFDIAAARAKHPGAFSGHVDRVFRVVPPVFSAIQFPWRDAELASAAGRYIYYESSRGCPFACAYCLSSRDDQELQFKSIETTCAELDRLLVQSPILVKLVDRTFNADPARARAIWKHLAAQDKGATRFHFEIHPALLETDDFEVLARVRPGLFQFEVGVQSVNPKALSAISRTVDWPAASRSIARLIKLGTVHIHLDLIVGLPEEGMAEIGASFDEVLALEPEHFQLGFLKALPGTTIRAHAMEMGLIHQSEAPYEILANRWLSPAELAELRIIEDLLDSTWNAGQGFAEMEQGARLSGGYFAFFRQLAEDAARIGYDVRTRQASKVLAFLNACLERMATQESP